MVNHPNRGRRNFRALAARAIAICPSLDRPRPYDLQNIRPDSERGGFWLHQSGGVKFQSYADVLAAVETAERTGRQCVLTIFAGLAVKD
jgi:hypothetical protein